MNFWVDIKGEQEQVGLFAKADVLQTNIKFSKLIGPRKKYVQKFLGRYKVDRYTIKTLKIIPSLQ